MRNSKDGVKELVHVGLEDTLEEEEGREEVRYYSGTLLTVIPDVRTLSLERPHCYVSF